VAARAGAALGHDFSSVRVHTDGQADQLGTRAFARGDDLHFAAGAYDPASSAGVSLIGHELTHVAQQREGRVAPTGEKDGVAINTDRSLESDADRGGEKVAQGFDLDGFLDFGLAPARTSSPTGAAVAQGEDLEAAPATAPAAAAAAPASAGTSRVVVGGGDYKYEQLGDGTIKVLAGKGGVPVVPPKVLPPGDPMNAAITKELNEKHGPFPPPAAAEPAPAEPPAVGAGGGEGTATASSDEGLTGGLIPTLDDIAADIGSALDGAADTVSGVITSVSDFLFGSDETPAEETPAPGESPAEPAPGEEAPAAPTTVTRPGQYLFESASTGSKSIKATAAVEVEVLETVVQDATIKNGNGATEAGKTEWKHVKSADGSIDHWTQFGALVSGDELSEDMVAVNQIPLDKIKDSKQRQVAQIWNEKGEFIDSARGSIERAVAVAVMAAESGGAGTSEGGTPVVRFENHKLFKNNEGLTVNWGSSNNETFDNHFRPRSGAENHEINVQGAKEGGEWTRFHGSQSMEREAIDLAARLGDMETALRCTSIGAGQVMGFNATALGYDSAEAMYEAMSSDINRNVGGVFDFIAANPEAGKALEANDFVAFAAKYNGAKYADGYGKVIGDHVARFRTLEATYLTPKAAE
jgi:hypothetical protein